MVLPDVELRHGWLSFEDMGLMEAVMQNYLRRLNDIYFKHPFRVPVLDFDSLALIGGGNDVDAMRDRLEMVHRNEAG